MSTTVASDTAANMKESVIEAYVVTNVVTGSKYIGITSRGHLARWHKHLLDVRSGRSGCRYLAAAILKYGELSFHVRHIASAKGWAAAGALEDAIIIQEGSLAPGGYNLRRGGRAGAPSPESFAVRSAAMRATWTTDRRKAWAAKMTGRKMPPSFSIKIKLANTGRKRTPEQRARMSAGRKGMKFSEEHRRNIGIAGRGRVPSELSRKAQSLTMIALRKTRRPGNASLTEGVVALIRARLAVGERVGNIARALDVTSCLVSDIKRGRIYRPLVAAAAESGRQAPADLERAPTAA